MRRTCIAAILLLAVPPASAARAQAPPAADVFIAELEERSGVLRLGAPVNVTARPGYDNQPHFTADGSALLYTSIRDGQADIYRYDVETREVRRLTHTLESEYSPTPLPAGGFSVVRVESDSTQRLWRFDDAGSLAELLLTEVQPVGYHAWADERRVALFVLGDPPTLRVADVHTGEVRAYAEDIGRSIQRVPGRAAVSFVQRIEGGRAFVVELEVTTGRLRTLLEAPPGGEYHAWTPEGVLLITAGSKLFEWRPGAGRGWRQVADLRTRGLMLTRLAVSPRGDRLAFVAHAAGQAP